MLGMMIHNSIAQIEEFLRRERFREEVREILVGGNERDDDVAILDALANEEMAPLDVLHAAAVLRVVGHGDRRLVVDGEMSGAGMLVSELGH